MRRRLLSIEPLEARTLLEGVPWNAHGLFPSEQYAVGDAPCAVAIGDLDRDGRMDLVSANYEGGGLSVLLGRGGGVFADQRALAVGGGPRAVAVGDFNGDNRLDLVAACEFDWTVSVLLGRGDGSFDNGEVREFDECPTAVAVGDLNGDSRLDVVLGSEDYGTVAVLLGLGDGTFQNQTVYAAGNGMSALVLGDVNSDQQLDVVTGNWDGTVSVLLGVGDGAFAAPAGYAVGRSPESVAMGDLNQDGCVDIVTTGSDDQVSVLLGLGDGLFAAGGSYATAYGPHSVAVADLNGDGRLDLVTANSDYQMSENSVSVLAGLGDGTFAPPVSYPAGLNPTSVSLGDFNGDSRLDVVTANAGSDSVSVLLNRADGTLDTSPEFSVVKSPYAVAVGDLNGDNRLDVVTANSEDNQISVLLGSGDGRFQASPLTFEAGSRPEAVVVGDVNGDGYSDVVTANPDSGTVSVLLGVGNGTFQTPIAYAAGDSCKFVALGDLNGDNRLDLVATHPDGVAISVLLNLGNGTFQSPVAYVTSIGIQSVVLGDLNRDGRLDVVANKSSGYFVLFGNGDGTLQAAFQAAWVPADYVAVGDVNKDGKLDVVGGSDNIFCVMLGRGDGTVASASWYYLNYNTTEGGTIALRDLNGDGRLDLVKTNPHSGTISVLINKGNGVFGSELAYPADCRTDSFALGDLNGDSRADVVTVDTRDSEVSVLLGRSNGSFELPMGCGLGGLPESVALGDLNGDNRVDVVLGHSNGVSVLLGLGDGQLQAQTTYAVGNRANAVALGDLNGDGHFDVITTHYYSDTLSVLLGRGDGSLAGPVTYATGAYPLALALGDLNGDGRLDVVTADYSGDTVSVLLGSGDGTLKARTAYAAGDGPGCVAIGDVDGDGHFDVVTTSSHRDTVSVLLGRGDGSLADPINYAAGDYPFAVALGDVNGDGRLDLVTSQYAGDTVSVFLGRGDKTFAAPVVFAAGSGHESIALDDVDGDGHLDIVTASYSGNFVSLLLGVGNGEFQPPATYGTGTGPVSVALGNLNGDRRLDIVTANRDFGSVSVLLQKRNRVTHTPSGGVAGPVDHVDVVFPGAMDQASFSIADDVLGFEGPAGSLSATGYVWINDSTLQVQFAPQTAAGDYSLVLGPQILDRAGDALDLDGDGLPGESPDDSYLATFRIDARGPRVYLTDPSLGAQAPLTRVSFQFSEDIAPASFSRADVVQFVGPNGQDLSGAITTTSVAGSVATVYFAPQSTPGVYRLTIGPQITDLAGNAMDQNRDGANGQANDTFTAAIDVHSLNLQVLSVADPVGGVVGQQLEAAWTVVNRGSGPAEGRWTDYVYLSRDATWDLNDPLVGEAVYDSSVRGPVAGNAGTYEASLTATIPAVLPGNYHLIVRTNLNRTLWESDYADNTGGNSNTTDFEVAALELALPVTSTVAFGDKLYYRIDVPEAHEGGHLNIAFQTDDVSASNSLYVAKDRIPSPADYDLAYRGLLSASPTIVWSYASAGTYYVLAATDDSTTRTGQPTRATISAAFSSSFKVSGASFGQGGTAGERTIKIYGSGLDAAVTVQLVDPASGKSYASEPTQVVNTSLNTKVLENTIFATFDLTQVPPGVYDVAFQKPGEQPITKEAAFEVVQIAALPECVPTITAAETFSRSTQLQDSILFNVSWRNQGLNDIPLAVFRIECSEPFAPVKVFGIAHDPYKPAPAGLVNSMTIWGSNQFADCPGRLLPGESVSRQFIAYPGNRKVVPTRTPVTYTVDRAYDDYGAPMDWSEIGRAIQSRIPDPVTASAAIAKIQADIGPTVGDYVRFLTAQVTAADGNGTFEAFEEKAIGGLILNAWAAVSTSVSGRIEAVSPDVSVSGRKVVIRDDATAQTFYAATDTRGGFVIPDIAPGSYRLAVEGLVLGSMSESLTVSQDDHLQGVVVTVSNGAWISGYVTDADYGNAVSGADVYAFDAASNLVGWAQTNAAGRYFISGIIPDSVVVVTASHSGFAPFYTSAAISTAWQQDIELAAPAVIIGHLAGRDSYENAIVTVESADVPSPYGIAVSMVNEDGSFFLEGLDAGMYTLHASDDVGYATVESILVTAAESFDVGIVTLSVETAPAAESLRASAAGAFGVPEPIYIPSGGCPELTGVGFPAPGLPSPLPLAMPWQWRDLTGDWLVAQLEIKGIAKVYGDEAAGLWKRYLNTSPRDPITFPLQYVEGSDMVEGPVIPYGTSGSIRLTHMGFRMNPLVNDVLYRTASVLEDFFRDYYSQEDHLCQDAGTTRSWMLCDPQIVSRLGDVHDTLESMWFDDLLTIPGLLAGGNGSGDLYSDSRAIAGFADVKADCSGKITITPHFVFDCIDTVDFLPGNPGDTWDVRAITSAFRSLEKYGWAHDVPFRVTFEAKPEDFLSNGESEIVIHMPAVKDQACPHSPPPSPCPANPPTPNTGPDAFRRWLQECSDSDSSSATSDCRSWDPNDISGPTGFGEQAWLHQATSLDYMIQFENDAELASAPARVVSVTQQLDSDLDWRSFRLGTISFGSHTIDDCEGLAGYEGRLDLRGEFGVFVDISAGIDATTGLAHWDLRAIDPETGLVPWDPLMGFLPPNSDGIMGQGSLTYSIEAKDTVVTGDRIDAVATIVFDENEPINTPAIFNTIDSGAPTSAVEPLPATVAGTDVAVAWTGADDAGGSGVKTYDVYVAKDGGPFTLWLNDTKAASGVYGGQIGHSYRFYSVAADWVGHIEAAPVVSDAETLVVEPKAVEVLQVGAAHDPLTVIQVQFDEPMTIQAMIDDGSIGGAVSLVNLSGGHVPLDAGQFTYDHATDTLTLALGYRLTQGNYELRLNGGLLISDAGHVLRGGASGIVYHLSTFDGAQVIQAGGGDLQVDDASVPAMADWNADGLLDLIVGEKTAAGEGKIRVYLNAGSNEVPVFGSFAYAQTPRGDLAVPAAGCLGVFPRVYDWNGDGKDDLVLGLADGRVQVWQNVAADREPVFDIPCYVQFGPSDAKSEITVGARAALAIVDWNNDGKDDFLVGGLDGRVRLFLNEGAGSEPEFLQETMIQDAGADLVVPSGRAAVAVADLNGDGRKDLVVGNTEGQLLLYANVGDDTAPAFNGSELLQADGAAIDLAGTPRSRPWVGDVNNDGAADLLVGATDTLVRLYVGHRQPPSSGAASGLAGATYYYSFTVDNIPPTATLSNNGPITYGETAVLRFADAFDPSREDQAAGFHYAYATSPDGFAGVTYHSGSTVVAACEFARLNAGDHVIYARIIDKDDGFSQYETHVHVDHASLTITADNKSRVVGEANPTFTGTIVGLKNGDIVGATYSSSATPTSPAGAYAIVPAAVDSNPPVLANYTVTQVNGTLLVNPAVSFSYSFGYGASPTPSGYTKVLPADLYTAARGYGWQVPPGSTAPTGFYSQKSGLPAPNDPLLCHGHSGKDDVFIQDLPAGSYQVTLILGDALATHNQVSALVNGTTVLFNQNTSAGQFVSSTFPVTLVSAQQLQVELKDANPLYTFAINDLFVRSAASVGAIAFDGTTTLTADGTSKATITGAANLPDGSYVTLTPNPAGLVQIVAASDAGGKLVADANSNYLGVQAVVKGGRFSFTVQAGTGLGPATIRATEVTGAAVGTANVNLIAPALRAYEFVYSLGDTISGYTGVLPTQLYSATRGYGWSKAGTALRRTGTYANPYYQDGETGTDNTFRVQIDASQPSYTVTVHMGDYAQSHGPAAIYVNGASVASDVSTTTTSFYTRSFIVAQSDFPASGILDVRFVCPSGMFVNGLEIATPLLAATTAKTSNGVAAITQKQLDRVAASALQIWAAAGISDAALARLKAEPLRVAHLAGNGCLAATGADEIAVDATAGGLGWFVDATPLANEEFQAKTSAGSLSAAARSPAYGRMDLLTAVLHEYGHVLGLPDIDPRNASDSLLTQTLSLGMRRLPKALSASKGNPALARDAARQMAIDAVLAELATGEWPIGSAGRGGKRPSKAVIG